MAPVGIAIVSLGQRSFSRAIDAINEFSDIWTLVAATGPDSKSSICFPIALSRCARLRNHRCDAPVEAVHACY